MLRHIAHWVLAAAMLGGGSLAHGVGVRALRCESATAPLGVDVARPLLSWQIVDDRPAEQAKDLRQAAFQVLVASTPELLAAGQGDLWDSGRVNSGQSIHVPYGGRALESRMRCHWKVRAWDADGNASPWSEPALWTMGLLKGEDWKGAWISAASGGGMEGAQWIWYPDADPITSAAPGTRQFRRTVSIPAGRKLLGATCLVRADNSFELSVNGQAAARGDDWKQVVKADVAKMMRPGDNVLSVTVVNGGTAPNPAGLIVKLRCTFEEGEPIEVVSDGRWEVSAGEGRWVAAKPLGQPEMAPWGTPSAEAACPWVRKTFDLAAAPDWGMVTVHSAGYFELYVNGQKVGEDVLTPAVSDLKHQSFSITYDVARLLKPGRNCIGLWLGTGWADAIAVRAQLDAVVGGKPVCIGTDTTWRTHASGLRRIGQRNWNNFGGELWDAREDRPGWCLPETDDRDWAMAIAARPPAGRVSTQPCPLNRIGERIPAAAVTALGDGRCEIDFGRNLTGWLQLRFQGLQRGQKVRLYFADRVYPDETQASPIGKIALARQSMISFRRADGGINGYQHFNQVSEFISAGQPGEQFQHKFNYAGFRYVVVEGLPSAPRKEDAVGLLVESALEPAGSFECSDELLNRIHQANLWTLRCLDLGGYVVDCPHRERMGYGDGQVSLAGMMMGMDSATFHAKWAQDWRQAQRENASLPNTAPWGQGGGGPPWGGAIAAVPWQHYLHYGNRRILEENYLPARRYAEYLDSRAQGDILRAWGSGFEFLGDWVPPNRGMDTQNWPSREMAELFCNCYRVHLWQTLADMAEAMGRADEAAHGRSRAEAIRKAVHAAFYDSANRRYVIDEQIYYAMPLMMGVTPEAERAAVLANLEKNILVKNQGHLDTGMLGTLFLVNYLDQIGRDDLVLGIYQQKTYPGWGYMVEQGATTLWEQWNGYWSQIHSCFTSADNWLYHGLAGIRPDPAGPGFGRVIIEPAAVGDITWVKAHHDGPYGRITSEWRKEGGNFTLQVQVPPNSTAMVILPDGSVREVGSGRRRWTIPVSTFAAPRTGG